MIKKRGITIVENLVAIALLTTLVIITIGSFVIAKMGAIRASHRIVAKGLIREYMEKEIANGYYFGQYITFASGTAATTTIEGITYSVTPEPYPATDNTEGGRHYKTIGFRVQWNEPIYGQVGSVSCSERAATYTAQHS